MVKKTLFFMRKYKYQIKVIFFILWFCSWFIFLFWMWNQTGDSNIENLKEISEDINFESLNDIDKVLYDWPLDEIKTEEQINDQKKKAVAIRGALTGATLGLMLGLVIKIILGI